VPYPAGQVRSVTVGFAAGRLYADVSAEVPVATYADGQGPDPDRVAGIDLGIIHPYAAARRAPGPGQCGSRRWRRHKRSQRKAEARHQRRVRQAQHEAAKAVISWAVERRIGTLAAPSFEAFAMLGIGPA
jgi:transposase